MTGAWAPNGIYGFRERLVASFGNCVAKDIQAGCAALINAQTEEKSPSSMWNEVSKTLGGNPTNTAWSEAYSALEQGVADGVEAPLSLLYSSKLYETRPNISLTGHVVATTSILMSQKVYDSLPDDAKKALDTVGRAESAKRIPKIQALETEFRKTLEDKGIRFNDVDKSSFFEAAAKVPDAFPEWTPGVYDKMNDIIK